MGLGLGLLKQMLPAPCILGIACQVRRQSAFSTFKDEAQAALFKGTVRTTL
jgi:hypothetical protein